jgi:hypothetical protein
MEPKMSQMVDSKQHQLTTDEIVQIAAREIKSPVPFDRIYTSIIAEFGMEGCKPYRFGNTLFVVHTTQPRHGFFRALNADIAQNYVASSRQFFHQAYADGFDLLVTQFEDPSILNIFRVLGREFKAKQQPGAGYAVQHLKDGKYQVTLILGPKRSA